MANGEMIQKIFPYAKVTFVGNSTDWENEEYKEISEKNWAKFTEHSRNTSLWFSDKSFWLTHKYDKRGRIYDVGYFINPQGNDYHKASIELAHKEVVNF